MIERNLVCSKCEGTMEVGVLPDVGYGKIYVTSWQQGAAEKGLLGGLKRIGKTRYEITAYRCTSCGYLENYAVP